MKPHKKILMTAGLINFGLAVFQAVIGFSPTASLYFGAPSALTENPTLLMGISLGVSALLILFGLYALSGAGRIQPLPWLKPILAVVTLLYLIRGLVLVPELFAILGLLDLSFPVAQRFLWFSGGALLLGLLHLAGIFRGWEEFPSRTS